MPEKTLLMKLSGHDLYRDGVLWVMQLSKCLNFVREDLVKIHSLLSDRIPVVVDDQGNLGVRVQILEFHGQLCAFDFVD